MAQELCKKELPRTSQSRYQQTGGDQKQGPVCDELSKVFFFVQEFFPFTLSALPFPISNFLFIKIQYCQQCLEAYVGPYSSICGDIAIYYNNEADLYMSTVDLSRTKAIPINIGKSKIFRKLINLARMVGPNYCPPNFNMIDGNILVLNWKSYLTKITKYLMTYVDVFVLVLIGDLEMIKGSPLLNIIAS